MATGLLLAILFCGVYWLARDNAIGQKKAELLTAMGSVANDPKHLEVRDFVEAYPQLFLTVYDDGSAAIAVQRGAVQLPKALGWTQRGNILSYGRVREDQIVTVGDDLRETEGGLERLGLVLGILWLPLVLFVGSVTWTAARLTFKPLERLTEQAAAMEGQSLGGRLVTQDSGEFGLFADQLNHMLERIEETVKREDQFASDAAHEFRTPLAIMRTRIETTLLRERSAGEYIASHETLLAELERLSRIVEALLRTARRIPIHVDPIDLEPEIQSAASRWLDRFVESDVFLQVKTERCFARIAEEEVAVVLDNLLDNALRFSPPSSTVSISLSLSGGEVRWMVADEGVGVPSELGEQIFERLVRSEDSRNRDSGGSGIGLAVCRKVLQSRGGTIALLAADGRKGARFMCTLPASE